MSAQPLRGVAYPIGDDPALSSQVHRELVDSLVTRTGIGVDEAERELDRRDLPGAFDRRFAAPGLSRHDLGDVLAAHTLAMWSIVHDAPLPDAATASAVRAQLAASLQGRPEAADPARRQLVGEALVCECMLSLESYGDARQRGERQPVPAMAEAAQRNVLERQGI
jgi:hypothetical protein